MKKLIAGFLVMGLIVGGFSIVSFAYGGFGRSGNESAPRENYDSSYCQDELGLSDEQLEEMTELRDDFFSERDSLREQLQDATRELRELQFSDASTEEIANVRNRISNLQTEMNNLQYDHRDRFKEVLTTEQLEKMSEYGYGQRQADFKGRFSDQTNRGKRDNRGGRGKQ